MTVISKLADLLITTIDAINQWIGRTVAWLAFVMVVVMFLIVALRYAFNIGSIAMQESITYMHATVFMLAAAYTLKHDGHVRVDIFYQKLGRKARAWIDVVGTAALLIPVCGFILWSSWEYVLSSWEIGESSREAGGLSWLYILKSTLLIMPTLLILQGIAEILRNFRLIFGTHAPR